MYERLFTPVKIGTMEVKNRFVVPAMDSHYTDEHHEYTEDALKAGDAKKAIYEATQLALEL